MAEQPGPDPAAVRAERIRALQRLLYAEDSVTDAATRQAATAELHALGAAHAVDSEPVAASGDFAQSPAIGSASGPTGRASDSSAAAIATSAAAVARSETRSRTLLTAGAAAALALVIGVVIGAATSGAIAGADRALPAPTAAHSLAEFSRDQIESDVPHIDLSRSFSRASFRLIANAGLDDVYLARDKGDRVCLVVVIQTRDYTASCVAEADLTPSGLRLLWTSLTPFRDVPGSQVSADFSFDWRPDGTTEMQSVE